MAAEIVTSGPKTPSHERPAELNANLIEAIVRAAKDPQVDVGKMEKLLEMQLRLVALAAEATFNQALARLKQRLPRVTKNGGIILKGGEVIKFARYEDIHAAVIPLLSDEGFTVSYTSDLAGANATLLKVTATFRHEDGHSASSSVFLPMIDEGGAKNRVQGHGSVLSYGRRYALCQGLDIVTESEDDDGMPGAMKPIDEKQRSQIVDLIADANADEKRFLQFMGVEKVEQIMVKDFQKAIGALNQKRGGKKS